MSNQNENRATPKFAPNSIGWSKALTHVILIAVPAICVIMGLLFMTGFFREEKVESTIKALDVFYGLGLLGIAALGLFTRSAVFWDKKTAPKNSTIFFALLAATTAVHSVLLGAITGKMFYYAITIISAFGVGALTVFNYLYFKKRKHIYKY